VLADFVEASARKLI